MSLSPTETRTLLERLSHSPNRKLGQNFLVDGNIVRKSVAMAEISRGLPVVEVGPGLGTLTRALLDAGARVWAIERDPALARHIREELGDVFKNQLHLTEGDALDLPLAGLPATLAAGDYRVVANLPYAVATPWMDAVLAGPLPERMVLMLQKEAGDRYTATPGNKTFGAISISLQAAFEIGDRHTVKARCFYPAPKVESVLLHLQRKAEPVVLDGATRECIRRIFTQRRKQLRALCREFPNPGAAKWFESLLEHGVSPTARPEVIHVDDWLRLQQFL